jgi:predicted DCC family thiol-disulfide oxidoreductase YuxK
MTPAQLVYDPDCGFCRVCVAVLLRWDRGGRLRPVALKSAEADTLLAGMPEAEQMASWHLANGGWVPNMSENDTNVARPTVWSAGAAFSPLFRLLPAGGPLARLTERFPAASERGYRLVADHRSAIGRLLPVATRRWADRVISESRPGDR